MSVLSKLKLGSRNMCPSPTPTLTVTLTPTVTPTPIPFSITYQSPADQTIDLGNSVVNVTVYAPSGGTYTATWQVWNGSSRYVTISSPSGTLGSGYNNFNGPGALSGTFTSYGGGPYQYYNENGGAGYYKFTITVGGTSIDTGFIRVYTRDAYACDCWCKSYGGGPQVGDYVCYGGESCSDNCCCYDCNGDGITCCDGGNPVSNCCRAECDPGDPGSACGTTCTCPTYYYCTAGSYSCETCYGSTFSPQY